MKPTIDRLLDRVGVLKTACDLDLLLFFHRHPRTLLTSEDLAAFVGYDLQQIARSLDTLISGGLMSRSQNRTHAARMYVLKDPDGTGPAGGWLPSLLRLAETRQGRAAVLAALQARDAGGPTAVIHTVRDAPAVRAEIAHA